MAVTAIWAVRTPAGKIIDYIRDPEKTAKRDIPELAACHADVSGTERRTHVTGLNCSPEYAAEQFGETKRLWSRITGIDKCEGRQCYHGYQSFAPGEVSAETAHEIGVKLAKQLWADRFEVVVATHSDRDHIHNHFSINSVSITDGHKLIFKLRDYQTMRDASDRLCDAYRLSVIDQPTARSLNYGEYLAEKQGKPTRRGMIRADIDRAVNASLTEPEFFRTLEEMGYKLLLWDEQGNPVKHPALQPPGGQVFYRFHKLGAPGYALDEILERVAANYHRRDPFPRDQREAARAERDALPADDAGLQGQYERYQAELRILKKYPASVRRVHSVMREDLKHMERLDQMTRLLGKNRIETIGELDRFRSGERQELETLLKQRSRCRTVLERAQRHGDEAGEAEARTEIAGLTKKIKEKRRNIRLCGGIEARSASMAEAMESLRQERDGITREEAEPHEQYLIGRGGTGREDQYGRG